MASDKDLIEVSVLYAMEARQVLVPLLLPRGVTAGEAVERSSLCIRFPEIAKRPRLARYGRFVDWNELLEDHDRLDILRPLLADPKDFRRHRAELQLAKMCKQ